MRKIYKFILGFILLISVIIGISLTAMLVRESKTADQAAPTDGQFIQTRDARVFAREEGPLNGKKVLLIHGTGAWGELWRDTTDVLVKQGYRVLTIDVPPFGFSERLKGSSSYNTAKQADRLLDVLDALKIEHINAICHSVGCRVMTEAVLKNPDRFEKFVLVDPALGFSTDQSNPFFQQNRPGLLTKWLLSPGFFRDALIAGYGSNPWFTKRIFSSFVFDKSSVTDKRVVVLQRPLVVEDGTRAQGDWFQNLIINEDHSLFTDFSKYKELNLPVLLVWGNEDDLTPLWQGKALTSMFSEAELKVINDTGHIPYLEETDTFNDLITNFLN